MFLIVQKKKSLINMIIFGTDCSGIGGAEAALDSLKIEYEYKFASEINIYARNQLDAHYKKPEQLYTDLKKREVKDMKYVDLYVSGFPCQPFSTLGKKQGFFDEKNRGEIIFNIIEYLKYHQPKYFILENVEGFLKNNGGKSFGQILEALTSISTKDAEEAEQTYYIKWKIINSKDFGTAQSRKRIYIVGSKNDTFEFPTAETKKIYLKDIIDPKETNKKTHTLSSLKNLEKVIKMYKEKNINIEKHCHIVDLGVSQDRLRLGKEIGVSPCLKTRCERYWITNLKRYITPKDALRIQGFPENWKTVCSDAQTLKQCGNSMSVCVLRAIIKNLVIE
jgi:DNA (cytosine-5)-methyltransferase 1